jgi:hypothetical protein
MSGDFPPQVPCKGDCAYGDECTPGMDYPGCGGCCSCARSCRLEWDVEHAYIPETAEQAQYRIHTEKMIAQGNHMWTWP